MTITYEDYPLVVCARQADALIKQGITVHQKWTCKHCGSRQTMATPNTFYQSGKCEECEQVTVFTHCNYLVISSNK